MRVLVTGGTGTVGLAIVERLAVEGDHVVALAASPPSEPIVDAFHEMPGSIEVVLADVRDGERLRRVLQDNGVESVVHGAAITPNASREMHQPEEVISVNCVGSAITFGAFADSCPGRFIHLSSIAAYGTATTTKTQLVENSGLESPENLYEITKLAGEQMVLRLAHLRQRQAISLRLGDIFGRWEHRTPARDMTSAPYQLLARAMNGTHATLPREGLKAWTYSRDIAEAVFQALRAEQITDLVANVGSPFSWSLQAWCALLATRFPSFSYSIDARGADIQLFADNAPMSLAAIERLGYRAQYDLESAFDDYIDWALLHPEFFAMS